MRQYAKNEEGKKRVAAKDDAMRGTRENNKRIRENKFYLTIARLSRFSYINIEYFSYILILIFYSCANNPIISAKCENCCKVYYILRHYEYFLTSPKERICLSNIFKN